MTYDLEGWNVERMPLHDIHAKLLEFCMAGPFEIELDTQLPEGVLGIWRNPRKLLYPPDMKEVAETIQTAEIAEREARN